MIKFTILLIIAYAQWGCNSRKHIERRSSSYSNKIADESRTREQTNERMSKSRVVLLSDSNKQRYSVKIFPLDTFSYSVQGGFKGKASKIEVIGSRDHIKRIVERESGLNVRQTTRQHTSTSEMSSLQKSSIKEVIKRKREGIVIVIACIGILIWVYCKTYRVLKGWAFKLPDD